MDLSTVKMMLSKDVVTAGYGVASSTLRKATSKLLGKKGVGATGVNAISIVAGLALSQVENTHAQIIGSALRITGIASMGNVLIDKIVNRNKVEK